MQKDTERKMTCLLVKAENCQKCQPIVYQRRGGTYSSYYSLPAATMPFLNTILGHTCHRSPVFLYYHRAPIYTHARTLTRMLFASLPPCLRELSVPLEDSEEKTLPLLEHVWQIPYHQTRRPQIHPSSPAHLIIAMKTQTQKWDRRCRKSWRLWLEKGNLRRKGGSRKGTEKEKCEFGAHSLLVLEPPAQTSSDSCEGGKWQGMFIQRPNK